MLSKHIGKGRGDKHHPISKSSSLPNIQLANAQVLENKLHNPCDPIRSQCDISYSNVLKLGKRLEYQDSAIQSDDLFHVHQSERREDSSEGKKGGRVWLMVNKDWCDSGEIKMLSVPPHLIGSYCQSNADHTSLYQRNCITEQELPCQIFNCFSFQKGLSHRHI